MKMRNWKIWGVLGLLLALGLAVGVGYGQPQPLPIPEPSLDVYAVRLEKEIHIFITLLSQGQLLTTPAAAESITVELQDRSARTLATQRFTDVLLAGTTQLIMLIPIPPPPEPWLLKVTAVVGGRTYVGETTVQTTLGYHPPPPPELLLASCPLNTWGCPPGAGASCPPFANASTGHNWASSGYQYVNGATGWAELFENGTRVVTGEGWAWFASATCTFSGTSLTARIQAIGNIRGEIEKPAGVPTASVILYTFVQVFNTAGQLVKQIGGIAWARDWDGSFNANFNTTLSGSASLPSGTYYIRAYAQVHARVKDHWRWGGPNGWVRVDELRLSSVKFCLQC